jgi:PAS domain S-box-containing protein
MHEKGRIEAAKILALSAHALGLMEDSFNYLQECLPYFIEKQDFTTLAHLYNLESFIYQQLVAPNQRLEASKKSSRCAEESGNKELLIRSLNNLGDAYLAANCTDDAIETFNRIQHELSEDDVFMRAVIQCNLAEAHLINGDFSSAHNSIGITLSTIEANNIHSLREASLIILGRIFLAESKFNQLVNLIEQWETLSTLISDASNLNDTVRLSLNSQIELNDLKIAAFEGMEDFESAFKLKKHNEFLQEKKNKDVSNNAISLFKLRNEINQLKSDSAQLTELVDKRTEDLKNAWNELRRKEAKSKTILNHSSNAIILLNADKEIIEINERGIHWFGKKTIGLSLLDLFDFDADVKNTVANDINRLLHIQDKQAASLRYEFKLKLNDCLIHFDTTISKLESEQSTHAVAFLHDITAHKELEELRLNELQLESAITALNELLHEKKSPKKAFDQFLHQLSEQLNFCEAQLFWFYESDKSIRSVSSYAKYVFLSPEENEDERSADSLL